MPTTSGIIDFILHPPVGALTSHADPAAPYTGFNNTIVAFAGVIPVSTTYGVYVTANSVPVAWGQYDGWIGPISENGNRYVKRIGQVVIQHQLASGLYVTTQTEDVVYDGQLIVWEDALPARIGIAAEPGCSLGLYYLT